MTVFTNNAGNDTFHGIAGEYDQVDYLHSLSEFTITRNADGSVTVFQGQGEQSGRIRPS